MAVVEKFYPKLNKVYFINNYTLFHIISGSGAIEVDFKNYVDWQDKAIYLDKGQYIKFLSEDFEVRRINFHNEIVFRNKDFRVLFKHLISLGYINFSECEECERHLSNAAFSSSGSEIIDISSKQWYWQNPFSATKEEYQTIFDIKEVIDQEYGNQLKAADLTSFIDKKESNARALVKDRIGLSIRAMLGNKRLTEGKKRVAFTDKSAKEISYEIGFDDPAYFNRVFRKSTGQTPMEFRTNFDFENRETFVGHLLELLKTHHAEQHSLGFYADKMNLSVKALSKKTRMKMNTSLGQLIRNELVLSSKKLLAEELPVKEVAIQLGFEEPNHFSNFFKRYTGSTPTQYRNKKYNS